MLKQILAIVVAAVFIAILASIWGFLQSRREEEEGTAGCNHDCASCMNHAGCMSREEK